ncbi:Outer membrane protein assembly factor BamE, lipoprotein component of the BamABCDE complex [Roseivivax sediminis]|uniref:Outer membrane protein assembly factor BamE, lipoprotein component of the BamABCDE complex n=2 Tax=Roseivivax sediminis TaxID=936889 RepID=A0A1I1WSI5_9RHOB|nr:Outer membrane protein assembly factor BamE, lipoprotein component of the BamABCDE complex [Roseivivax sediminis]
MRGRGVTANMRTVAVMALAVAAFSGCTAQYRNHGYIPPEEELARIVPGIDTRATVEDVVGVPTSESMLADRGYYWVSSRMRSFAWQRPEVVQRQVVAISFDPGGVVQGVERYGLEDGRVVPITRRVTDNADSDIGFIRRLFGNIGGLQLSDLANRN